uniref:Protein TsetseEP domain-containing protein n=1 Tax=Bactrocera dorsalis TaxID=27457 RepID=A0A034VRD0_BACDO
MATKALLSLLLATIVSSALAQSPVDWQPLLDQQNLVLRQVVQALQLTRSGAGDTDACFDWYLDNQTAINEVYYTEYNLCVSAATAAKKLLSEQSALERQDLLDEGQSLCSALSACESFTDGLQFFQCYNEASSTKSPTLFNISVTSERIADKLKISYQAINDTERVCTTNARVKNVEDLSVSRAHLNNCLIGTWSPPETTDAATASTDTTTEATASTEAPGSTVISPEATTASDAPTSEPSDGRQGLPEEDLFDFSYMTNMLQRKLNGRF